MTIFVLTTYLAAVLLGWVAHLLFDRDGKVVSSSSEVERFLALAATNAMLRSGLNGG
jgi:hypothetical protein